MTSLLSVFAKPTHGTAWLDYVRALQPYDILILDPDLQQISDAHQASPESEITIRRWDWDDGRTEQNQHGVYAMLRDDPAGLAQRHADQYGALVAGYEQEAKRRGIPFPAREQLVMHLVNEPDTNSLMPQINRYTVVACKLLWNAGLKVDGLNLSTGHPAHLVNGEPDWTPLLEALEVLEKSGSYAAVHEYYNSLGIRHPGTNPWHILRHHWAPRGPKYKIGEFGLEEILNKLMPDHHGWRGRISPEQAVENTEWYLANVRDDVMAVRKYMTDYVDRAWRTFDTTPIHSQLIEVGRRFASKSPSTPSTNPPETIHLPSVPGSGKPAQPASPTAVVSVPAGANIRTGPGTSFDILGAVPSATPLSVVGKNQGGDWWQVLSEWGTGWVSATIVRTHNVEGVPVTAVNVVQPQPSGSDFGRVMPFILRWEGTWADNPADPGGATMKGITIGTYTRWREAHGQPKPTVNDLRNISDVEVLQIYKEWYWKESGADKLPWPLCLAHMDTAVNAGVGRAQEMLQKSDGDFLAYMGHLIDWYTRIPNFEHFGRAWIRRRAEILLEAAK